MARQISVSDEIYKELSKFKGNKSFSEFIKERIGVNKDNKKILKFAGILKKDGKNLKELKKIIAKERELNYGRDISW